MATPIASISKSEFEINTNGNMGGTAGHFFIAQASAFASITLDETEKTAEFTFEDDTAEVFAKIDMTDKLGELKFEVQGEQDGKSFKGTLEVPLPSLHPKAIKFLNRLLNETCIVVGKDMQGQWALLGTLDSPANLDTGTASTGKGGSGKRGSVFMLTADMKQIYTVAVEPQHVLSPII